MAIHSRPVIARVTVRFFYAPDGQIAHLIEVEGVAGALRPRLVLRLALVAISQRLRQFGKRQPR